VVTRDDADDGAAYDDIRVNPRLARAAAADRETMGPGSAIGEIAFFTQTAQRVVRASPALPRGRKPACSDAAARCALSTDPLRAAQTVRATEPCRVLSVSRDTYRALEEMFPTTARLVMSNLSMQALRSIQVLHDILNSSIDKKLAGTDNFNVGFRALVVRSRLVRLARLPCCSQAGSTPRRPLQSHSPALTLP